MGSGQLSIHFLFYIRWVVTKQALDVIIVV